MTGIRAVADRLGRSDMLQVLAVFLAALVFVLATRWPGGPAAPNEAWFSLAQTRLTLLALVGLAYGAAVSQEDRAEQGATAASLAAFALLSMPFDLATYAASYPAVPLGWTLGLPFLEVVAYYGIGVVLGRAATAGHLRALLPIVVPAVLAAAVYFDVRLGLNLLNPLTAAVRVSLAHLLAMAGLSVATCLALALRRRKETA